MLDLSDGLEREDNKAVPYDISTLLAAIEVDLWNVVGYSWEKKLDNDLLGDIVKYRKYNTNSVCDLLRVIRNKRHHYHDLDNRCVSGYRSRSSLRAIFKQAFLFPDPLQGKARSGERRIKE